MKITSLKAFENELAALIGRPTDMRPFVCDGSPLECSVFIVGLNAASNLHVDFWTHWSMEKGFDKHQWFECYKENRRKQPLKPGKTRRNEISNTRRVIEWIVEELKPNKVLETNIFTTATEEYADLKQHQRSTETFDFLTEAIAPKLFVVHGKDATEHVSRRQLPGCIIQASHFSRGWSKIKALELAAQIKEKL